MTISQKVKTGDFEQGTDTPTNSQYYGTDASGVKGFHDLPTGSTPSPSSPSVFREGFVFGNEQFQQGGAGGLLDLGTSNVLASFSAPGVDQRIYQSYDDGSHVYDVYVNQVRKKDRSYPFSTITTLSLIPASFGSEALSYHFDDANDRIFVISRQGSSTFNIRIIEKSTMTILDTSPDLATRFGPGLDDAIYSVAKKCFWDGSHLVFAGLGPNHLNTEGRRQFIRKMDISTWTLVDSIKLDDQNSDVYDMVQGDTPDTYYTAREDGSFFVLNRTTFGGSVLVIDTDPDSIRYLARTASHVYWYGTRKVVRSAIGSSTSSIFESRSASGGQMHINAEQVLVGDYVMMYKSADSLPNDEVMFKHETLAYPEFVYETDIPGDTFIPVFFTL